MLRKILLVVVLVSLVAIVGCKKEEPIIPEAQQSAVDSAKEQADAAAAEAAKQAEAAKEEAGKQVENLGKEIQK